MALPQTSLLARHEGAAEGAAMLRGPRGLLRDVRARAVLAGDPVQQNPRVRAVVARVQRHGEGPALQPRKHPDLRAQAS